MTQIDSDADFDVIVIGGGGAGMSAALMAADQGARVLLVEAGARCGGATALSSGAFYAANTRVQHAAGIVNDSAETMFNYAMTLNRYRMLPTVLRRFCEDGSEALHWLMDLGVKFKRLSPSDVSGSGLPRSHWAEGHGAGITDVLEGQLQTVGVEVATHTRVRKLITANDAVIGIEADGARVHAKAVVIASGGFGANEALLARLYPDAQVEGRWYVGPDTSQGDALEFGTEVGATIYGENRGLQLLSPGFERTLGPLSGWLIFVNRLGQRFVKEDAHYGIQNSAMQGQPGRTGFAIFDQSAFDNPPDDFRFAPLIAAGDIPTDWRHDSLEAALRDGKIVKGETLADLAEKIKIPAAALAATIERYNAGVEAGTDSQFYKDPRLLHKISGGPYYAATLRMQILGITSCGLRIDEEARVVNAAGRPIAGLYAAGETTGGPMGEVYIGSGNSVANAITFGRIAGKNAGRFSQSNFSPA